MRYNKFLVLGLIIFLASCKKDYLNTVPTQFVAEQSVFSTTEGALGALNGIHRSMWQQYENQDEAGQGSMMINLDLMGEDMVNNGGTATSFTNSIYRWDAHRNVNSSQTLYAYRFYYKIIANADMIINNIDKATGTDAERKAIKGQALTYRAWAHFVLVQLYGKRYDASAKPNNQPGVPIMLTNTTEGQPRATVEEVYTQINKDLDEAIVNLTGYTRPAKSHININVAKGVKARVALTMQDWANAAKFAVEARTGFTLMNNTQYREGFNSVANPEWIWGSAVQNDQGTFFYSFFAYMSNFSANATRINPKSINSSLYNAISATDIRKQVWDPAGVTPPTSGTRFPFTSSKFQVKDIAISVGDVVYMRAAEMYLIEAEANARLGKIGEAQDPLTILAKNRDPNYVPTSTTSQALINEIMFQRRIELWGEGFRFLDLKRTNTPLNRNGANHRASLAVVYDVPAGDNRWEWLIPQTEINANPQMVQNPL
ncbi:RagB/SusD family nutrient uptake outer membrane protein [Segetibacter sp. 3557_3]|uniref:RagB/SusD family nutrient uptake outer membrane protein n=1 Tax=Segetibacter sp. 3557_3 TaxID=2547429 RepID=UPI001058A0E1|nr:RagB/SusD family nutrient uptake outer membrane protein [Segetibacter sp. 3557_3]TDH24081.1 RagB/SusD family nutrient uptake outer membrane protein [Segetibacter sp. 3557_3]